MASPAAAAFFHGAQLRLQHGLPYLACRAAPSGVEAQVGRRDAALVELLAEPAALRQLHAVGIELDEPEAQLRASAASSKISPSPSARRRRTLWPRPRQPSHGEPQEPSHSARSGSVQPLLLVPVKQTRQPVLQRVRRHEGRERAFWQAQSVKAAPAGRAPPPPPSWAGWRCMHPSPASADIPARSQPR